MVDHFWRILVKTYNGRLYLRHMRNCEKCLTQYSQITEAREVAAENAIKTAGYIIEANHPESNIL